MSSYPSMKDNNSNGNFQVNKKLNGQIFLFQLVSLLKQFGERMSHFREKNNWYVPWELWWRQKSKVRILVDMDQVVDRPNAGGN